MEKINEIYFENIKNYFSKIKNIINKENIPTNNEIFITKHTNNNFNLIVNCFLKTFQIKNEEEFEKSKSVITYSV